MSKSAPVLVGMDCGSGNVATVMATSDSMKVRLTPSYVRHLPGATKGTDLRNMWITKGDNGSNATYAVQSKAINVVDTRTKDYQLSAACRVLVVNAISSLGLAGRKVIIADTLPADQFYDDNNSLNRTHIEKKRESLKMAVRNANADIHSPEIIEVRIMPEGVTAFNAALYQQDGSSEPRLEGVSDVVIVDIGRYTINYAHIDCDTQDLFARATSDQGVHAFLTLLKQLMIESAEDGMLAIPAETIRKMTLDDIDAVARAGYYGSPIEALKDKRIPVVDVVKAAASTYVEEIKYKLSVVVPQLGNAHALIVVGGGAHYVGGLLHNMPNYIADLHDNVIIPHQPECANARGAFIALQAEFEDEELTTEGS